MAEQSGVLVVVEVANGRLIPPALEALGAARQLAGATRQSIGAALLGSQLTGLAEEAIAHGADKVYVVDDLALAEFTSDAYVAVLQSLVKETTPSIVLLSHTTNGREVAPRLAFRLGTGLASDCQSLALDASTGRLVATRSCYGGAVQMTATWPAGVNPQMASLRPKSQEAAPRQAGRRGEIVAVGAGVNPAQLGTHHLETVQVESEGIKLEDAEIIVAGGRGVGSAENFQQYVEVLAKVLGAAVGASRAIVDDGWVPYAYQVGLTGKTVSPNLYIAIGISGASQHMAGCTGSRYIVGINRDQSADVFKYARFGAVGDYRRIVPAFQRKVEELLRA